jgi:hypothetical protein
MGAMQVLESRAQGKEKPYFHIDFLVPNLRKILEQLICTFLFCVVMVYGGFWLLQA